MHTSALFGQPLPRTSVAVLPRSQWEEARAALRASAHQADYFEPADLEKPVTVADVKALRAFASRTAVSDYKVAVLHDASAFRIETANALLKLLEEPPDRLYIVCLSESPFLLPTVRSRLQVLATPGSSATMDGDGNAALRLWQQLAEQYPTDTPEGRERLRQLSFLQPLIHTTIKPETILEPFIRP